MKLTLSEQKRQAWRDLKGCASPAAWMSDEELEAITPRMVRLREIKAAVSLANSAPDLLAENARLREALKPLLQLAEDLADDYEAFGVPEMAVKARTALESGVKE